MNRMRALLVTGGIGFMIVRPLVSNSWDGLWGISYNTYNQLAALPFLLLLLGTVALLRSGAVRFGPGARVGLGVIAAGLFLSLAGIIIEFYVGGGLQAGPKYLAQWGWGAYLLGGLVQIIGLVVYGLTGRSSGALWGVWGALPLVMAALALLFPVGMALQWDGRLVIAFELLFGLGWCLWGYALSEVRGAATVGGAPR